MVSKKRKKSSVAARKQVRSRRQKRVTAQPTLSQVRRDSALMREVGALTDVEMVLDRLVAELIDSDDFDGYVIALRDETGLNLVCEKISLPGEHKKLEASVLKCNYPLNMPDVLVTSFSTRQTIFVDRTNYQEFTDPATPLRFERWGIDALAVVPILSGASMSNQAIGALMLLRCHGSIDRKKVKHLQRRLMSFENAVRNALAHAWLGRRGKALDMVAKEQGDFLKFITHISNATSPDSIYTLSCREFLQRLNFDLAAIFMHQDKQMCACKLVVRREAHTEVLQRLEAYYNHTTYEVEFSDGIIPIVYMQNKHYLFPDAQKLMHLQMAPKDREGMTMTGTPRTSLVIPIRRQGQPIGVLWLLSIDDVVVVSDADIKLIEMVGEFIGAALESARVRQLSEGQTREIEALNKELQSKIGALNELALRDWLTGLNNYGSFEQELLRRVDEYQREQGARELSLILIDIDHFKALNDNHGHVAGNNVLREVARRMSGVVRTMDFTARYGGEEFVVILPKCSLADAQNVAEKIRRSIANEAFGVDGKSLAVTVSAGCCAYVPNENADVFVKRVDHALYQAKRNGRNRVEVAPDLAAAS